MAVGTLQTVFITGGGSGIGEGLARAFHARGAKVIIAGRDMEKLAAVTQDCFGMDAVTIDVTSEESVRHCAEEIGERYPYLNCIVNNAGLQQILRFDEEEQPPPEAIDLEIETNFRGLVRVSSAFLPLLRRQAASRLIHVSSGLAFVPMASAPIYSATKAAVHAFTVALRRQLRGTGVRVIELIPPAVDTPLFDGQHRRPPRAMPVATFARLAMKAIESGRSELPIGSAIALRTGSRIAPGLLRTLVNFGR